MVIPSSIVFVMCLGAFTLGMWCGKQLPKETANG